MRLKTTGITAGGIIKVAAADVTTTAVTKIGTRTAAEVTTMIVATITTITTIGAVTVAVDAITMAVNAADAAAVAIPSTMAIVPIATRIGDYIVGGTGIAPIHLVNAPPMRTDTRSTPRLTT